MSLHRPPVPDVRRIAVLRANGLGDFVFALPALDALRATYPDAELVLIGRDWHRELLDGRPSPVDRVVALPHPFIGDEAGPPPDPAVRRRILAELRAEPWDLAIQLHGGGGNTNPLVAALGARVSAGATAHGIQPLDRSIPYVYWQHEVLRQLEVVGLVGAAPVDVQPRLVVTEEDRRAASEALDRAIGMEAAGGAIRPGGPWVVIHPGAGDPRRRWPVDSFAAVGRAIADLGFDVVVTGTAGEAALTGELTSALMARGVRAVDLTGRLRLPALVGLLAESALVLTNDTGPLHLADAVGGRTVGVFWCGNLVTAGPVGRARHRPLISWRLDCPVCATDCTQGRCDHTASFVADVPVADVLAASVALLGRDGR